MLCAHVYIFTVILECSLLSQVENKVFEENKSSRCRQHFVRAGTGRRARTASPYGAPQRDSPSATMRTGSEVRDFRQRARVWAGAPVRRAHTENPTSTPNFPK